MNVLMKLNKTENEYLIIKKRKNVSIIRVLYTCSKKVKN